MVSPCLVPHYFTAIFVRGNHRHFVRAPDREESQIREVPPLAKQHQPHVAPLTYFKPLAMFLNLRSFSVTYDVFL